jgi:hypothetical protein
MFKISDTHRIETDLPIISENYQILHFDEIPILFTGMNRFGNRIIGSSVDEDYTVGFERYFHIILDAADYTAFLRRRKSYRSLLQEAKPIFVLDMLFEEGSKTPTIYQLTFEEIPDDYKPLQDSYCPQRLLTPSHLYSVELGGHLADSGRLEPREAGETQNLFDQVLRYAFGGLEDILGIKPQSLLAPSSTASFMLNFEFKVNESQGHLFRREIDYFSYLNAYLAYCINNLHEDIDSLIMDEYSRLEEFQNLLSLYLSLFTEVDDQEKERHVHELAQSIYSVAGVLNDLSMHIGNNYNKIFIANISDEGENPLGVIDDKYKTQIETIISKIENRIGQNSIEVDIDQSPQSYRIQIYDLNRNSRKGLALVYSGPSRRASRPSITISGSESGQPLARSKYTESLHFGHFIDVRGIATREGNRIRSIEIQYER